MLLLIEMVMNAIQSLKFCSSKKKDIIYRQLVLQLHLAHWLPSTNWQCLQGTVSLDCSESCVIFVLHICGVFADLLKLGSANKTLAIISKYQTGLSMFAINFPEPPPSLLLGTAYYLASHHSALSLRILSLFSHPDCVCIWSTLCIKSFYPYD